MTSERISIKGTSDGLIINIGAGAWPQLLNELDAHLGQKASFFKGGRVALQVGHRRLTTHQLEVVGNLLDKHGVSLWAVESDTSATQLATSSLGLEVGLVARQTTDTTTNRLPVGNSIVIRRTLRSGQVVNHPGDVVIIGDVNPGAEIKAGGSVIVWGRLRGTVHAGVGEAGNKAIVCALQLLPTQLRINNYISRPPIDQENHNVVTPEMASVENGQIVAEAWSM
jgi:septum site-determining protein MinC